jgi:hypothetical protein
MKLLTRAVICSLVLVSLTPVGASAQESKSSELAKQLAAALDAGKLDSIAARDPAAPDVFVAALYFPGSQLLVIAGKYAVPQLLNERVGRKEYRDVYLDLNGASASDSKVFIEDPGADGLKARREENQAFDQCEIGGKRMMFNGDWKAQKLSEDDYMKAYSAADDRYAQILTALLAQAKKSS